MDEAEARARCVPLHARDVVGAKEGGHRRRAFALTVSANWATLATAAGMFLGLRCAFVALGERAKV